MRQKDVLKKGVLFVSLMFFSFLNGYSIGNDTTYILKKNGKPYTGKAQFKFAIVSDYTTLWSNDGSSVDGVEPYGSCTYTVKRGIYTAEVGAKPMKPFFYELLNLYPKAHLKTWVDIGSGFNLLSDIPVCVSDFTEFKPSSENNRLKMHALKSNKKGLKQATPLGEAKKTEGSTEQHEDGELEEILKERARKKSGGSGIIPFDALMNAVKKISLMKPLPTEDAGLWTWEWLGPGNIGGRIRTMAIKPTNPGVIFVGSASGGIWKSVNAGNSWMPVNDFLPNLCITSIVYDPVNTNIMYASTGEGLGGWDGIDGAGIFKSVNGGSTWTQLPSTNNAAFRWVNDLAHHPTISGVIYAVTSPSTGTGGIIYKSIDAGTTWTVLYESSSRKLQVVISPHNPKRVLVGTDSGLLGSTNGLSFTPYTPSNLSNGRVQAAFCPSDSNRVYASVNENGGELYRSDNSGNTWTLANTGTMYLNTQGGFMNALWVDPLNSDRVIVGGFNLYRSVDSGQVLTKFSNGGYYHNGGPANTAHWDHYKMVNHPDYDAQTNNLVYFVNDGGIQKTDNVWTATETTGWTNLCGTTLGITQFYGGAASPDGSIIIGGTQDNDSPRFRKSGDWSGVTDWYQAESGDGGYCAIDPTNPNIIYTEYINLTIEKSSNGGDNYTVKTNGLSDAGSQSMSLFIAPFVMDPNNSSTLVAGGTSIWRSTDAAENWSSVMSSPGGYTNNQGKYVYYCCSAIDIALGNSNVIWVGYDNGNVYKTVNGTSGTPTWTRVDTGIPDRWISDIAINPFNSDEVFITLSGYFSDDVWFTSDGGNNWVQRTGTAPYNLPEVSVNTIRFHPLNSNWVYVGTDLGVFASMDKGANWSTYTRYETNEGPCNVAVEELFWQGNEFLIAATHGRGMYRAHPLTIIYVDKNALPGGDGSIGHPYQTVTEAENNAGWGSSIYIKSNTYDENNGLMLYKKGVIQTTNGKTVIK